MQRRNVVVSEGDRWLSRDIDTHSIPLKIMQKNVGLYNEEVHFVRHIYFVNHLNQLDPITVPELSERRQKIKDDNKKLMHYLTGVV